MNSKINQTVTYCNSECYVYICKLINCFSVRTCYWLCSSCVSGAMSRDQKGRIYTARTATLQKIMKFRMESQQKHELMQKRMRQRSSMKNQNLEPKPPDYFQYRSSKHKRIKKEEADHGEQHIKPSANTWSRPHQSSLIPKSNFLYSDYTPVTDVQLYAFSGKSDYLE